MPCTWLKITSQYDLSDYAVEVRLDRIGILDYVRDDGSDIYFLDENNQPLYYAVWLIRKDKRYGSVFVKLSLQANNPRRIQLCYGGENPYASYRNPDTVFDLYDDFNEFDQSKWYVEWGEPRIENGHLVLPSNTYVLSVRKFGDVEVRVYYKFDDAVRYFIVGARFEDDDIWGEVYIEASNGWQMIYQWYYDRVSGIYDYCYTDATYEDIYQTGVYYEEVLRTVTVEDKVDSTWIVQGYMDNRFSLNIRCLAPNEGSIELFSYGNTVKVDKLFVRYAVDPEPTVELAEAPQPPPEEPSPPPPPPEQPPPPELKPQPYPKPWILLLLPLLFFIFRKKEEKKQ
ncbi:MAG: DUF2341 domain-containing protein [Desulfurococcaceae archaeon]